MRKREDGVRDEERSDFVCDINQLMKLQVVLPESIELKKRKFHHQLSSLICMCSNLQSIPFDSFNQQLFQKALHYFLIVQIHFLHFSLLEADFSNELSRSAIFKSLSTSSISLSYQHVPSLSRTGFFSLFLRGHLVHFIDLFFPYILNKVNLPCAKSNPCL